MQQIFAVLDATNTVVNIIESDQAFIDANCPGSPVLKTPGGVGSIYDGASEDFSIPQAPSP